MNKMRRAALALIATVLFGATAAAAPALIVEVKCKPGTAELWLNDFEKEIVPSIKEAIAKGDGFTGFRYAEDALPGQHFDYLLIFEAKSFGELDTRRPFPHFTALFRRVGPDRAKQIIGEMNAWEAEVHITLARTRTP